MDAIVGSASAPFIRFFSLEFIFLCVEQVGEDTEGTCPSTLCVGDFAGATPPIVMIKVFMGR